MSTCVCLCECDAAVSRAREDRGKEDFDECLCDENSRKRRMEALKGVRESIERSLRG